MDRTALIGNSNFFTTKETGTGLGLATVHSIISQHSGSIELVPSPARGTTFLIRLKAASTAPDPSLLPDATWSQPIAPKTHGRILVMDDQPYLRMMAQKALELKGYKVYAASEGNEAIQLFEASIKEEKPFDLVILDLTIAGGVGGEATFKKLKDIDPQVKAIASSGYTRGDVIANPEAHGFLGALIKPYTIEQLESAVAAIL